MSIQGPVVYHFEFFNNFNSLKELLFVYQQILDKHEQEKINFHILIKEQAPWGLTWPNEKANCLQTLYFAASQMNTEYLTVHLDYEESL